MSTDNAIKATPSAIEHLKKHLQKHAGEGVRLSIVKSGCSGYRYEVTFIDVENPVTEQDKMFLLEEHLPLYISRKIFPMLMGTTIDYMKKGLGSGELVYNNPQQTGACGCGESFTLDESEKK
jgi:iron-sulfur cluster assembly protein